MQAEVNAPPGWQSIDFISDLHLAAETPRTFEAWADYMHRTPADAVFILGDLFEVWVGDDTRFEGFEGRCAEVLTKATQQRSVFFMVGNRDFLVGTEMLDACGVTALADPCLLTAFGERVLLTHGDELCVADIEYQKFRAMVRNPAWQAKALAQPLDVRRHMGREVRSQSEMRKHGTTSPADWVDIDPAMATAWLHDANAPTLIHGHTHRPGSEPLGTAGTRHVLTDWDMDHSPHRAEVFRVSAAGMARLSLHDALT